MNHPTVYKVVKIALPQTFTAVKYSILINAAVIDQLRTILVSNNKSSNNKSSSSSKVIIVMK